MTTANDERIASTEAKRNGEAMRAVRDGRFSDRSESGPAGSFATFGGVRVSASESAMLRGGGIFSPRMTRLGVDSFRVFCVVRGYRSGRRSAAGPHGESGQIWPEIFLSKLTTHDVSRIRESCSRLPQTAKMTERHAPANPAIAARLQADALVGRVAGS